ncbi:hypothetical protein K438DRAFT_1782635 [Mycena galopus ATCC 62051]|nr:hypothetical protein K438DRAFT_1782635 [Mycena galopus ATCC 62051]
MFRVGGEPWLIDIFFRVWRPEASARATLSVEGKVKKGETKRQRPHTDRLLSAANTTPIPRNSSRRDKVTMLVKTCNTGISRGSFQPLESVLTKDPLITENLERVQMTVWQIWKVTGYRFRYILGHGVDEKNPLRQAQDRTRLGCRQDQVIE